MGKKKKQESINNQKCILKGIYLFKFEFHYTTIVGIRAIFFFFQKPLISVCRSTNVFTLKTYVLSHVSRNNRHIFKKKKKNLKSFDDKSSLGQINSLSPFNIF